MNDLPIFLINLDDSVQRLRLATEQLDHAGLNFRRVPAVDGRTCPVESLPGYDPDAALNCLGRTMRGGEIGCYLSHLLCIERFLDSGADFGAVLEDDILPGQGFTTGLGGVLDWLACRPGVWNVVHLAPVRHKIYTPLADLDRGHRLTHAHYFPMTTTALLWTRHGAEAFWAQHRRIVMPVDMCLRYWLARTDRGLAVWPPLARTTGADSEIASRARPRRSSGGRHPLYPLMNQRRMAADKLWAIRHKLFNKNGLPGGDTA